MLPKIFITLITFVTIIYVTGFQLQPTNDQFLSGNLISDDLVLQDYPNVNIYNEQNPDIRKRAYVRLAGKRALVRLGKRAFVRLGKRNYLLPY
uniref:Uncharacterized protein n=1 Tax=Strongyloides stercoralis TaxID=6248 RepID=A0A0K0DZJ7_STRER